MSFLPVGRAGWVGRCASGEDAPGIRSHRCMLKRSSTRGARPGTRPLRGTHPWGESISAATSLAARVDVEVGRDVGVAAEPAVAVGVVDALSSSPSMSIFTVGARVPPRRKLSCGADRVDERLHQTAGHDVVRVRLEVARVLVVVGCERLAAGEVEVRRVAERESRTAVERLVVAADAVADEAVDALGSVDSLRERAAVTDGEQVVLAVLEVELRTLGLVGDAVGREDRRQELPLGQVVVGRLGEADVADLEGAAEALTSSTVSAYGSPGLVAEVLLGARAVSRCMAELPSKTM